MAVVPVVSFLPLPTVPATLCVNIIAEALALVAIMLAPATAFMASINRVVTVARVSPVTAVQDAVWGAPVVSCHVALATFPAVTAPPSIKKATAETSAIARTMETSATSTPFSPVVMVNAIVWLPAIHQVGSVDEAVPTVFLTAGPMAPTAAVVTWTSASVVGALQEMIVPAPLVVAATTAMLSPGTNV